MFFPQANTFTFWLLMFDTVVFIVLWFAILSGITNEIFDYMNRDKNNSK